MRTTRNWLLTGSCFLLLLLCACSKTKTITVMDSGKWSVGQHYQCFYGHTKMFCASKDEIGLVTAPTDKDRSLMAFFIEHGRTLYGVTLDHDQLSDKERESGEFADYQTRFDHDTVDFSLWDCYKTGAGSPGVECSLTRKPTGKETMQFMETEKKQEDLHKRAPAIAKYLTGLSVEQLEQACGSFETVKSIDALFEVGKTRGARRDTSYGTIYVRLPHSDFQFSDLFPPMRLEKAGSWYAAPRSIRDPSIFSPDDAAVRAVKDEPCVLSRVPSATK